MEAKQFSALVALGRELRHNPKLAEATTTIAARLAAHGITMHSLTAWTHVDLTSEGAPGKDDWSAFSLGVLAALRVLQPAFLPTAKINAEAKAEEKRPIENENENEDEDAVEDEDAIESEDVCAASKPAPAPAPAPSASDPETNSTSTSTACALQ
jgi:hypothetical protein